MALNQASARPSRSTNRANYDGAPQPFIKNEDVDDETYRPRPQLPKPTVLMRSLDYLMKLMQSGGIDVDPAYQREVVWTADRMTGLVDSLMENFYIPPIILNKKPRVDQNDATFQETLVCVDGKQRLSSVLAFIKGLIPCHDHRGEKWWFCEPVGSKRKRVLSEQQQRQFYKKDFVSFEFNNLSPEQEEDLFARVQMGVQLNLAEKMRASTGPWQELASLFVESFPDVYALMKDRARSKDFQLTLSCFSQIVECMHPTNANGVPMLKTNHTYLPKLLSNKGAVDDGLKSHLRIVWVTFEELIKADPDTFTNGNKYLRGVQTFAPVEMVAVTVLISMHSETRNNRLLLGDIQAMRTAVREKFADLRLNASVWKWFWEYIDELEGIRGAVDGSTVDRQTTQRPKNSAAASAGGSTAAAITAAAAAPKRGRATARTTRPAVTTAEEVPVVVKQELEPSPLSDARVLKRRRTGDSPLDQLAASTPSTYLPPTDLPPEWIRSEPELPPKPTHALIQSPQPVVQTDATRKTPASPAPPRTAPSSVVSARSQISRTPAEARQQRFTESNGYNPSHSPTTSVQALEMDGDVRAVQSRAPIAPMLSSPTGFDHREHPQSGGVPVSEVTSQMPPRPRSTHEPQKGNRRPAQEENEIIDLTSDTEQERQSLLSAFKTKPATSSKSAATSDAQKRGSIARTSSQDLPTRENNPYARYKASGGAR